MAPVDLVRRLAVAAVGIPLALWVLIEGGWYLTGAVAFLAVLANLEMHALAVARGIRTFSALGAAGTFALIGLSGWAQSFSAAAPWTLAVILGVFFLSSAFALRYRNTEERPLLVVALTTTSVLYLGLCLSFAVFLWYLPLVSGWPDTGRFSQGPVLLAFPLAVAWTADTAAYLVGHAIGRRKLAPRVSPGKTIEGSIASLCTAILVGAFVGWGFLAWPLDPVARTFMGGGLGLVLGVSVQIGDLIESHFKREAGVKDSGSLLPGHGGILDRFDALLFSLPLAYALFLLLSRMP